MQANDGAPRPLGELALDAVQDVKKQVDLDGRVERNPFGSVAAAIGIGYVLGGGLFTPLTARAVGLGLRLGVRLMVLPLVTEHLVALAQSTVAGPIPAELFPNEAVRPRNGGSGVGTGI